MRVLVVDVGGTCVKILATGQDTPREFPSGPLMTAEVMVTGAMKAAGEWEYDAVSLGYPGLLADGVPAAEPCNLGSGWVGYDFAAAFGCPVRLMNDAAMQALGSYEGGKMLFLGLGTGLGSAMVVDGVAEPMELGNLPYRKGTYGKYASAGVLERAGVRKWRHYVADIVGRLSAALEPDYIILGGGNVHRLKSLPPHCRTGDGGAAFRAGFEMWGGVNLAAPRPVASAAAAAHGGGM